MSSRAAPVLVDTSVWTRIASRAEVAAAVSAKLASGQALCTCPLVDFELLHSARGPAEYDEWAATRAQAYLSLPLTPAVGQRALQVQQQLAHRGLHRAAKLPDLLIAAIAETAGRDRAALRLRLRPHRRHHRPTHRMDRRPRKYRLTSVPAA